MFLLSPQIANPQILGLIRRCNSANVLGVQVRYFFVINPHYRKYANFLREDRGKKLGSQIADS